ncbi:MAG: IS1380 family transposase, partial [Gaiellaceae bacterium]
ALGAQRRPAGRQQPAAQDAGVQDAGVQDAGVVVLDFDATIVISHSEKEQATRTWKNSLH